MVNDGGEGGMYYFYIVVFLVGVFYTFVSLVISGISGAFHGGGNVGSGVDGHFGHHGHVDIGHAEIGHAEIGHIHSDAGSMGQVDHSPGHHGGDMHGDHGAHESTGGSHGILSWFSVLINPLVAVSFLTVFGGFGIMGVKLSSWSSAIVFAAALVSAIVVSAILYNFVVKPVYKSENTSNVSREQLIGIQAEVTTNILEEGFGTIQYTVNSLKCTGPARHIEDKAVSQGQRVIICRIENNTFYVSEMQEI